MTKIILLQTKKIKHLVNFPISYIDSVPSLLIGKMRNIAFVQDPDGYWIEILNNGAMKEVSSNMIDK